MANMNDKPGNLRSAPQPIGRAISPARERVDQELSEAKAALETRTCEFAQSLAMMEATLESTTDAIIITDAQGRITSFNTRFAAMWGFPRAIIKPGEEAHLRQLASRLVKNPEGFIARIEEIRSSCPPESFDVLEFHDGRVIERYSKLQGT